jgi:hypothetical protein
MKKALIIAVMLLSLGVSAAFADTQTGFDDLNGNGGSLISNPYQGLTWTNFYVVDPSTAGLVPSGYANGVVSQPNVAFNGFGSDASISSGEGTFNFNSAWFTAAWNDGLKIDITAYNGEEQVHTITITVDTNGPQLFTFDWSGITSLTFHAYGGIHNDAFNGNGTHFVMDNFNTPVAVPEPGTLMLLGSGILAFAGRRRFLR